jgi:hypothetical protein
MDEDEAREAEIQREKDEGLRERVEENDKAEANAEAEMDK